MSFGMPNRDKEPYIYQGYEEDLVQYLVDGSSFFGVFRGADLGLDKAVLNPYVDDTNKEADQGPNYCFVDDDRTLRLSEIKGMQRISRERVENVWIPALNRNVIHGIPGDLYVPAKPVSKLSSKLRGLWYFITH